MFVTLRHLDSHLIVMVIHWRDFWKGVQDVICFLAEITLFALWRMHQGKQEQSRTQDQIRGSGCSRVRYCLEQGSSYPEIMIRSRHILRVVRIY